MKKRMTVLALVVALSSGCATQSFRVSDSPAMSAPRVDRMQPFFLSGIGQTQEVDAAAACAHEANQVARVESSLAFTDVLLNTLTSIFIPIPFINPFTPRTAQVYCVAPGT
ncbi:MAG: hypothetical protein AB3X41_08320 [Leptothrix ochracea]|uniref:Bor/Iss family lipoprotein n=1 Tax=Leptothrix ochracea TaxID=735331 RepID=UPI0034E26A22